MEIKGDQSDFDAVLSEDYFVRYAACENLLQANEIPLKIADLRRVFFHIAFGFDRVNDEARQHFLKAQAGLIRFIKEYGQPLNYAELTSDEINEYFLDACCRTSTKPDLAVIKELVEHGADINAHDSMGFSALKHATAIYDREVMKFFLERGANINEVIRYTDQNVSTVWLNKVGYAEPEDLRLMLAHGARPNDCDSKGNTALLKYCEARPVREGVALLLEYGASVKPINAEGNSGLHLAARTDADASTIQLLIEAGADVNLRNADGDTPLHLNARFQLAGDERVAICLLEHGADADLRNPDGDTPLLLAASCDKELVVKALMGHGASKEIKNAAGKVAYKIAIERAFLKTALHIDPQAFADYEVIVEKSGLRKIQAQIIESLKAGSNHYRSNKEGYSVFSCRDGVYIDEDYIEGASPPVVSTFKTDESALEYLYSINRSYSSNETELKTYQSILASLHR